MEDWKTGSAEIVGRAECGIENGRRSKKEAKQRKERGERREERGERRAEERGGGKEGIGRGRARWSRYH